MWEKKISLTYSIVGVSISKDNLKEREFKELIKVFPKGTYVCMRFKGTYEHAQIYYEKLIDYISEKWYEIVDDSLEMELVDPSLSIRKSEVVTELQMLVKK